MSDNSKIEWTDATWGPVTGCSKVSAGCKNCYAERMAERFRGTPGHYFENGFDIKLRPDKMEQPLHWRRPRRIFVNSMSDLFHPDVPDNYIDKVFAVMALCPQHTFQVLTKRPERMRDYLRDRKENVCESLAFNAPDGERVIELLGGEWIPPQIGEFGRLELRGYFDGFKIPWPLPNVWIGVSVENQKAADERIPLLLQTPAAVRFLSCEPLLGPVNLFQAGALSGGVVNEIEFSAHGNIDWVIAGGESGPGARPMDEEWVRSLKDQCVAAGVSFFYKQKLERGRKVELPELDGRTWDEFPEVQP